MSEKIADIVAQMRGRGEDGRMDMSLWRQYADRIEEAAKREKAETEAEALACGGIVEASRQKLVGNAAAMREALVQCELFLGNVSRHGHPTLNPGDKCTACNGADELRGMVVRALSAPARNCDIHTDFNDAITSLADRRNWQDGKWDSERYCILANWLLAAEEGGADGAQSAS